MDLFNTISAWITSRTAKKNTKEVIDQREKDRRQQLAMAALSERLAAHQKAYAIWYRITRLVHKDYDKLWDAIVAGQEWWVDNCLYLVRDAREAFLDSIHAAGQHDALTKAWKQKAQAGYDAVDALELANENWRDIHAFGKIVQDSVDFPAPSQKGLFPELDPEIEKEKKRISGG